MSSLAAVSEEGGAENSSDIPAKRARISNEARGALVKAFDNANVLQNHKIQSVMNDEIKGVMGLHGLTLDQVKRQFTRWKNNKYFHGSVVCNMNTDEITAVVESHLASHDIKGFVREVLMGMIPGTEENSRHASNRKDFFDDFVRCDKENGVSILEAILSSDSLVSFFVKVVQNFIAIAVEAFPKTAASLPQSEFAFFRGRMEAMNKKFAKEFVSLAPQQIPNITCCWRTVVVSLEDALFRSWCNLQYQTQRLPIIISDDADKATEYSRPVVYYIAGWIISNMAKGGGLRKDVKENYAAFAQTHTISKEEAAALDLPSDIIDRKDCDNRLMRPSKEFFQFILRIETIYIQNLTIDMMLSHYEGDLLQEIARSIETDSSVMSQFRMMAAGMDLPDNLLDEILTYVLTKFARMRGNWFMKALSGQASVSHKAVAQMATRKNVAAVSAAASAASAARRKADKDNNNNKKQQDQQEDENATTVEHIIDQNRNEMYKTLFDTVLTGEVVDGGLEMSAEDLD